MTVQYKEKRNRTFAWLILLSSLCAMVIFGHQLWSIQQNYNEGNESYEQLIRRVRPGRPYAVELPQTYWANAESYEQPVDYVRPVGLPTSGENDGSDENDVIDESDESNESDESDARPAGGERHDESHDFHSPGSPGTQWKLKVKIPEMPVDFAALNVINPDAAAWLYCPDTPIDYPVMRATDYDYYLHHLPDGTTNVNGSLFIDYNWTDFTDQLTVIYGHNMKSGRMFGSLTKYKERAYFEAHPYLYLYSSEGENFRVDLLYGCVIGAGQWRERAFMFKENVDALIAYAAQNTTFTSEASYEKGDRVIALSTCSYEFDDARYVVIGVLRPEYGVD